MHFHLIQIPSQKITRLPVSLSCAEIQSQNGGAFLFLVNRAHRGLILQASS